MNPIEFIGRDSFRQFATHFQKLEIESVFLVTGTTSYTESGAEEMIQPLLKGRQSIHFAEFASNPQLNDVIAGANLLRENPSDVVLAVGGGSALDVAKCVSLLSQNRADETALVIGDQSVTNAAVPIVAVPTTAGTGSEATRFATVYIGKTKHSLEHDSILPAITVVDPAFTMTLPPYQTAVTGIDALSQAVESYWSTESTSESKEFAAKAIELAVDNLRNAVNEPDDESRLNMMIAANLAGKAINISKTTACHALSYYLTSHFGVSHGHAVGMMLSKMLIYNGEVTEEDVNDKRGASYVRDTMHRLTALLSAADLTGAARRIDNLMADIGLGDPIPKLRLDDKHIENMVRESLKSSRMANNPRKFTAKALTSLLNSKSF
jgi:alcohol dehydrogenase class IV